MEMLISNADDGNDDNVGNGTNANVIAQTVCQCQSIANSQQIRHQNTQFYGSQYKFLYNRKITGNSHYMSPTPNSDHILKRFYSSTSLVNYFYDNKYEFR